MKTKLSSKKIRLFILFLALSPMPLALCQIPQGFNYQAVARDATGHSIINTAMQVRITIQSDTLGGTIFRKELFPSVVTNSYGLISIVIGKGQKISGAATLSDIDWSVWPKYIMTEINYGGWITMGSSKLWSVPYAMKAKDTETKQTLSLAGLNLSISGGNSVTLPAGSNLWQTDGTNIYRTTGNVGIGTATPGYKFVNTGDAVLGTTYINNSGYVELNNFGTGNRFSLIDFHGDDTYTDYAFRIIRYNSGPDANTYLYHRGIGQFNMSAQDAGYLTFSTSAIERMRITPTGNIGIGTAAPLEKLHINGNIYIQGSIGLGINNPTSKMVIQPSATWDNNTPLFEVRNKAGQTVFAVYNEGVRVYVADGAKGLKGGFAVGGFGTDKAESQKYLVVSKDSVRIYLDTNPLTKKMKGGFSVGGYDLTKETLIEDYLQVNRDSTRIYVNEGSGKAQKGGFAVGGFDITKGTQTITPFTSLTSANYFIGHEAGKAITNGVYNLFLGYNAGRSTTGGTQVLGEWQGCNNIFIGYNSGYANTTGYKNVFLGYQSGKANTSGVKNTFIGNESGVSNTTGGYNTFLGYNTGIVNSSGGGNSFVGADCGFYNKTSYYNTCMGTYAGENLSTGGYNTFIGAQSGHGGGTPGSYPSQFLTGNYNTALGYRSGYSNVAGNGNVFLGYQAGYSETGSNKLYIANSSTNPPLIFGDFSTGNVGIGTITPAYKLEVTGSAAKTTGIYWTSVSDARLKDIHGAYTKSIDELMTINPVLFSYKEGNLRNMPSDITYIGLVAQDIQPAFPEAVTEGPDGYLEIDMQPVNIALINAVKELKKQIESQKKEIDELKTLVNTLIANQTAQENK